MVGGARNRDRETETSAEFELNEKIHSILERYLREIILPGEAVPIDQRWSGIMGFREPQRPWAKRVSDRIAVGSGCNGMGMAMGSVMGKETADLFDDRSRP
jgi:glycine/D-amino acid oxidase-like deaminating enzyme